MHGVVFGDWSEERRERKEVNTKDGRGECMISAASDRVASLHTDGHNSA